MTDEGSDVTKIVFDAVLPVSKPIKVDLQDDELVEETSVLPNHPAVCGCSTEGDRGMHDVFERKAQHRGKDSARFCERLNVVIDVAQREWEAERGQYVFPLPTMTSFERELRRALRPALRRTEA